MHRSQFAGLIIDCDADDLGTAAEFWSEALGYAKKNSESAGLYVGLVTPENGPYFEVQKVDHESRVHLDIESDDLEAEAERLKAIGARRIGKVKQWIVMEAPTGQKFCIVPPESKNFMDTAHVWGAD